MNKEENDWLKKEVEKLDFIELDHRFGLMSDKYVSLYKIKRIIELMDKRNEKIFYAKVKGHELLDLDVKDDDENGVPAEFYRNVYFVVQYDGKLIIDMKDNGLLGSINAMSKKRWVEKGVNDENADFFEVSE